MRTTSACRSINRDDPIMARSALSTGKIARARSGMTLVELLVVLLILSILTVVAVQATDTLVDQARYDSTQRTLQSVEEAIVGPRGQRDADGSVLVTGFVADVGRFPLAMGSDPLTQLQE